MFSRQKTPASSKSLRGAAAWVVLSLVGCETVRETDEAGRVVTETVVSPEKVVAAGEALAPFIPGRWGAILPLAAGIAALVIPKEKTP